LPAIAINSLTQNQEIGGIVHVRADAASDAPLGRVDFFVDDKLVASDGITPYTFDWDTRALAGEHIVSAKAYGLTTIYEAVAPPISVTVK